MIWVEFDASGDLVNGTIAGWDALTGDRWADLEDRSTEKDCHLLTGWLLGLSAVSATMSIAGLSIRRKAARAFVYVVPFLFGVAPSIGID